MEIAPCISPGGHEWGPVRRMGEQVCGKCRRTKEGVRVYSEEEKADVLARFGFRL